MSNRMSQMYFAWRQVVATAIIFVFLESGLKDASNKTKIKSLCPAVPDIFEGAIWEVQYGGCMTLHHD